MPGPTEFHTSQAQPCLGPAVEQYSDCTGTDLLHLQVTLSTLVTDGAVQRVIGQQEFHHPFSARTHTQFSYQRILSRQHCFIVFLVSHSIVLFTYFYGMTFRRKHR